MMVSGGYICSPVNSFYETAYYIPGVVMLSRFDTGIAGKWAAYRGNCWTLTGNPSSLAQLHKSVA